MGHDVRLLTKSMTDCATGGGCVPVDVSSASHSGMYVEMAGCRYRAVFLPICTSLLLVTSSTSLSSGNPVCADVIHIV